MRFNPIFFVAALCASFFIWVSDSQEVISADPAYYYNLCNTSSCGNVSLLYPFAIPRFCGHPDLKSTCVDNQHLVLGSNKVPQAEPHRVVSSFAIDSLGINVYIASDALFGCGQVTRSNFMADPNVFSLSNDYKYGTHLNCTQQPAAAPAGSLEHSACMDCNGSTTGNNVCFYVPGFINYPPGCENFFVYTLENVNVSAIVDLRDYLKRGYQIRYTQTVSCGGCVSTGGRCGSSPTGAFMCYCPRSAHRQNCSDGVAEDLSTWLPKSGKSKISKGAIVGIAVAASIVAIIAIATVVAIFVRRRRPRSEKGTQSGSHDTLNTETDIKDLVTGISPARYSLSQIKKFTSNFSTKLGEGGYGTVYKGFMEGSGPVAVKLLRKSQQSEKQFMNEVATVGRVHHHNLVRLLGYCAQGNTRALVYEFMEKGSLEKYIYDRKKVEEELGEKEKVSPLTSRQMYNIALETARGILYLHEGCRSRILHCDIKPHNVLLTSDFSAKVADFGLARMIDKDHSHVSLTQAQGTPGYAAPEMWSKSYGPVTDKSDVFSYGMLLLEMAGRRKNYDSGMDNSSQAFFPEWVFRQAENGEWRVRAGVGGGSRIGKDGGEAMEEDSEQEEELFKKMCLVGLWCIQHIPSNRPSMSRVIQMLEGNVNIETPPCPFPEETGPDSFPSYYFSASSNPVFHSVTDETH